MIYVTLPHNFIAIRYPGYFWNTDDQSLYSLKREGILRKLRIRYPNKFNRMAVPYYQLSVGGRKKLVTQDYLNKLTPTESKIPTYDNTSQIPRYW